VDQKYLFVIEGEIMPYVRMTRRGKYTDPRAQAYMASQTAIQWQLNCQMVDRNLPMLPPQTPLSVSIVIWTDRGHTCDADNLAKAIIDAAQGIVFKNDLWIDWLHVERRHGEREHCQLWIDKL
jgi:Holliday junction resolvase RusA-like endonuclease